MISTEIFTETNDQKFKKKSRTKFQKCFDIKVKLDELHGDLKILHLTN